MGRACSTLTVVLIPKTLKHPRAPKGLFRRPRSTGANLQENLIENVMAAVEQASELTGQMLAYSGRGRYASESLSLAKQIECSWRQC
jgi:hypothetical protein